MSTASKVCGRVLTERVREMNEGLTGGEQCCFQLIASKQGKTEGNAQIVVGLTTFRISDSRLND